MKFGKKALSIFLCLIMMLGTIAVCASADENSKIGDMVKVKIVSAHKWYLEGEIV